LFLRVAERPVSAGHPTRAPGIDGLRAVAVLAVVACHCVLFSGPPIETLGIFAVVARGWMGVDLFFVISGFLITRLLLAEEQATGRINLVAFYARRSVRILPLYYLVLFGNLFVLGSFPTFSAQPFTALWSASPAETASLFAFLSNYSTTRFYISLPLCYQVLWSLCVEEHFYLFWSLFLWLVLRRTKRLGVAVVIVLAVPLARLGAGLAGAASIGALQAASHFRMDSILWGALGALCFEQLRDRAQLRRVVGVAAAVLVAATLVAFPQDVTPRHPVALAVVYSALAVAALALVVDVAARPTGPLTLVLDARPLRFVGRISFGVYLLHPAAIDVVNALITALVARPTLVHLAAHIVLSAIVAIVAAAVVYAVVERPLLAWKERRFVRPGAGIL
jgi:peptidoglycan/LPS O-acetylase OafA/YrhL